MFFYSKKSSRKVFHYGHCPYARHMDKGTKGKFETMDEARAAGYHLCKCCAPMGRHYRKEYKEIERFARVNGLIFSYEDGAVNIQSPRSAWKVITAGRENKLFIYHKNTQQRKPDKEHPSIVPGYHSQAIRKTSILGYMEFVLQHDAYRRTHPDADPPKYAPPPMKGTKRYKKEQKRLKQRQRAESIREVLALIDMQSRLSFAG